MSQSMQLYEIANTVANEMDGFFDIKTRGGQSINKFLYF